MCFRAPGTRRRFEIHKNGSGINGCRLITYFVAKVQNLCRPYALEKIFYFEWMILVNVTNTDYHARRKRWHSVHFWRSANACIHVCTHVCCIRIRTTNKTLTNLSVRHVTSSPHSHSCKKPMAKKVKQK